MSKVKQVAKALKPHMKKALRTYVKKHLGFMWSDELLGNFSTEEEKKILKKFGLEHSDKETTEAWGIASDEIEKSILKVLK